MIAVHRSKWNNGDLEHSPPRRRVHVGHAQRVAAAPARVFALACPAGQGRDGLGLMAPTTGVLSAFSLPSLLRRPELASVTFLTLRDAEQRRAHLFVAAGDLVLGTLRLGVSDAGGNAEVQTSLTLTALSEQGDALLTGDLGERMGSSLMELLTALERLALWDDGDTEPESEPVSETRTCTVDHQAAARADADACFALACPVAELEWIDGWCFDLIYSESGGNEEGCIFREPMSGLGVLLSPGTDTIWYTTLYDAWARRFEAVLLVPGLTVGRFSLAVDEPGEGQAVMRWEVTCSGLGKRGNSIIAEPGFEVRMLEMLELLARSARRYLETGEIYRLSAGARARVVLSAISAVIDRHVQRTLRRG